MPKEFGIERIPEIQVIGRAQWDRARTSEVPRGFSYREFAAFVGIEIDVAGVAIDREGDELLVREGWREFTFWS